MEEIKDLENEVWKDVVGYEGLYKVSSLGRVMSLGRTARNGRKFPSGILNRFVTNKYYSVRLTKGDGTQTAFRVHRLVCLAFISNPNNYPCINHKDEDKLNNCVDNLEWCTYKYNNNYGSYSEKLSKAVYGKKMKRVVQMTMGGKDIKVWDGIIRAKEAIGINLNICGCCKGKQKSAGGYKWRYTEEIE